MTRIWLVRLAPCYFSSLLLLGKSSTPRHEKSIAIPSIDNVTKSVAASLFAHSVPSTTLRLLLGNGAGGETGVYFGRSGGKPFELIYHAPAISRLIFAISDSLPANVTGKSNLSIAA